MKTMLCVRCGELVPQGCCTCGPRQELVDTESRWPEMMEVMGKELGRMLDWRDVAMKALKRSLRIVGACADGERMAMHAIEYYDPKEACVQLHQVIEDVGFIEESRAAYLAWEDWQR